MRINEIEKKERKKKQVIVVKELSKLNKLIWNIIPNELPDTHSTHKEQNRKSKNKRAKIFVKIKLNQLSFHVEYMPGIRCSSQSQHWQKHYRNSLPLLY